MGKRKRPDGNGQPVNKSAAIRDMLSTHAEAPVKEIVSLLGEQGIRVQPTLVYYIKSKQRQLVRRQRRQRATESTAQSGAADPVKLVMQVKALAKEVGGIRGLKRLVDILAE